LQTQAIVFEKPHRVSVRSFEMPDPGEGELQIRTTFSTVSSGTEGWSLAGRFTWQATPFPCVPGYQRVGIVEAVGAGVEGWQKGDRVFAASGHWKAEISPFWGSHLSLANTQSAQVYALPGEVDEVDASGLVVAQVGYNAAYRPELAAGNWVVVYGDGLIGQFAAQAARSRGARVILVGHREERLDLARQYSADAVINNHQQPVADTVRRYTGNAAVVAVLDTVQQPPVQLEYIELLEPGQGQIVYCGFTPGTEWADMALLQKKELTAHFISGWNRQRINATIELIKTGDLRLRPLITHRVSYRQGPDMYKMIGSKNSPFLGIVLDWRE
jgi:2-desacetyl-2-hydroxyethyl bacteriochlorophyllide A dehydrogenase